MAPTQDQIKEMFKHYETQGQQHKFFDHVADDVNWTVMGHSPISKEYPNKQAFLDATLGLLKEKVLTEPLRVRVINVIGGGADSEYAAVELRAIDGQCKNGSKYDMTYCWVLKFNQDNIITTARAYLDTKLLTDAVEQNP